MPNCPSSAAARHRFLHRIHVPEAVNWRALRGTEFGRTAASMSGSPFESPTNRYSSLRRSRAASTSEYGFSFFHCRMIARTSSSGTLSPTCSNRYARAQRLISLNGVYGPGTNESIIESRKCIARYRQSSISASYSLSYESKRSARAGMSVASRSSSVSHRSNARTFVSARRVSVATIDIQLRQNRRLIYDLFLLAEGYHTSIYWPLRNWSRY